MKNHVQVVSKWRKFLVEAVREKFPGDQPIVSCELTDWNPRTFGVSLSVSRLKNRYTSPETEMALRAVTEKPPLVLNNGHYFFRAEELPTALLRRREKAVAIGREYRPRHDAYLTVERIRECLKPVQDLLKGPEYEAADLSFLKNDLGDKMRRLMAIRRRLSRELKKMNEVKLRKSGSKLFCDIAAHLGIGPSGSTHLVFRVVDDRYLYYNTPLKQKS